MLSQKLLSTTVTIILLLTFTYFTTITAKNDTAKSKKTTKTPSSPSIGIKTVSASKAHTCTLLTDGTIKCWGSKTYGRAYAGTRTTPYNTSVGETDYGTIGDRSSHMGQNLPTLSYLGPHHSNARAHTLVAGWDHDCAIIDKDDSLTCWGRNDYGQLGRSSNKEPPYEVNKYIKSVNVDLGGRAVRDVSVGQSHTCAILDDGSLKCWGHNKYGQLGLGDTLNRDDNLSVDDIDEFLPSVNLGTNRTARRVTAGRCFTCVILDDDSLKCWGTDRYGQLGLGNFNTKGDAPLLMGDLLPTVDVGTDRTVRDVSAGSDHVCALLDDDSLKCWGYGGDSQLGYGDRMSRGARSIQMGDNLPPVDVGVGRTVETLSTGRFHTCVVLDDESVKCWGRNDFGQLGSGGRDDVGYLPEHMGENLTRVDLGEGVTVKQVSAGGSHSCAVLMDGKGLKCWGHNLFGQLGYGDKTVRGRRPDDMGDNLPTINLGIQSVQSEEMNDDDTTEF